MVPQYGLDLRYRQGKEGGLALRYPPPAATCLRPDSGSYLRWVTVTIKVEHAGNSRFRSRMDNT